MINEYENKNSQKMSDLEYDKNQTEMMRYRVNGLSNKLGLCAMGCSLLGAFICLNSMQPSNFQTILIILMNIVILLGGFLAAEKVKNYSHKGAIAQIVFGGVCAARIFYVPLLLMIMMSKYDGFIAMNKDTSLSRKERLEALSEANKIKDSWLGVTITTKIDEANVANAILPSSAYFRATASMVLFGCAAALFIAAGIIGYIRATKLSKYLESIENK